MNRFLTTIVPALLLAACGGGNSVVQITLVDETRTLAETAQISYPLAIGSYRAEVTSSRNGVAVLWVGGSGCQSSTETRSYSAVCDIGSVGTLIVANPTLLGVAGDELITIRITRL